MVRFVLLSIAALMVLWVSPATAGEPVVAWESRFEQARPADGKLFYEDRGSGKSGDAVMVNEVTGGILKYGLKHDPARLADRLSLLYGNNEWWPGDVTKWGPFELTKYPILEITWRGTGFDGIYYCLQTQSGALRSAYAFPDTGRKVKDDQGREWYVSDMRFAPDSAVPTASTAVKLLGLNFAISSPSKAEGSVTEIKSIRVRGFTDAEAASEKNIAEAFTDYPQGRWAGLDEFFPFGYYMGYLSKDFDSWAGGYEGDYGIYSRNYFNYVPGTDEVELGRFGSGDDAVKAYIEAMKGLMDAARSTGMKIGADVRRLMQGHDPADGYKQLLPITRQLAGAFPGDTVVSWYCYDEPGLDALITVGMNVRAIREADPPKRPELVIFNNTATAGAYAKLLNLNFWDCYPVLQGNRDPWAIRGLTREYRKTIPGKPAWVTLQAFETRPPAPKGSYIRPSDAEMRMMAYEAIAEGAKGLIWYIGWDGVGRDQGMETRTGEARGGMLDTLADLGRRTIPIGRLLLATEPMDTSGIITTQTTEPAEGHSVVVSALQHQKKPVWYLVAVNEDLDRPRAARIKLPDTMTAKGCGVYDLYNLDGKNLLAGDQVSIETLAGGDGRVYLVADAKTFKGVQARIICDTALEDVRVLTADISIARRWGVKLSAVDAAIAECREAARKGETAKATAAAREAKALLEKATSDNSEFNSTRRALADISKELTEVETVAEYPTQDPKWWTGRMHPMLVPNPGFVGISKQYWETGRAYAKLKTRYIKGEKDGLWIDLNKTRLDCLKMREDILTLQRDKLKPVSEKPTE